MHWGTKAVVTVLAGVALAGSVSANAASLIPALTGSSGGTFFYDVNLSKSLITNDGMSYVTLYDIPGYIAGSATVITGSFSEVDELTSPPAVNQSTPDNSTLLNARFIYNGADFNGPATVATISIKSTFQNVGFDVMRYDGQDRSLVPAHTLEGNTGTVDGPAVPEMSMLPIFGTLLGLGGFAIRRRNKS